MCFSQNYKGQKEVRTSNKVNASMGVEGKKKCILFVAKDHDCRKETGQISLLTFGVESTSSSYGIGPSS